jgi:toxin HigB-1
VIGSFRGRATGDIFNGISSKEARRIPQSIWKVARRKLDMLNAAHQLADLRIPPANRLDALKGNLSGRYSIRINDQFRILFRWSDGGPAEVEIMDYH